jgi:hypothetical protein
MKHFIQVQDKFALAASPESRALSCFADDCALLCSAQRTLNRVHLNVKKVLDER